MFRQREVQKTYLAVVHGTVVAEDGEIVTPVGSKKAYTRYQVVERIAREFTKVLLYPSTGRKHQLRKHMKGIGHPIVGDRRYSIPRENHKQVGTAVNLQLFAVSLKFVHPVDGRMINVDYKDTAIVTEAVGQLKISTGTTGLE